MYVIPTCRYSKINSAILNCFFLSWLIHFSCPFFNITYLSDNTQVNIIIKKIHNQEEKMA